MDAWSEGKLLVVLTGLLLILAAPVLADEHETASSVSESTSDRLEAERLAAERLFWQSVKDSEDRADIQAYLDKYPDGEYAVLARNRLKRLASSPEQITSPTPNSADGDGPPAESTTPVIVQEPDNAPKRIIRAIAGQLDQWFDSTGLRLALAAPIWAEEGEDDTITIHFPGARLVHRREDLSYELGDLAMAVTPQSDADYGFEAMLPATVAFPRGQITVDRGEISGIWQSDLDMPSTLDVTVSGLRMINNRKQEAINVGSLTVSRTADRSPERLWNDHTTLSLSDFRLAPDLLDQGLKLSRLNVKVSAQDADLDTLLTMLRTGMSAGDKGEAEALEFFLQGRYGRLEADVTVHDLITIVGGNVILRIGGLNTRAVLDNREELADLEVMIEADEFHIDETISDGLPPEVTPSAATIGIAVRRYPLRRLATKFVDMMDAARNGEASKRRLEQVMMTELAAAKTSLDIQKFRIVAPMFEVEAGGLLQVNPKSDFGATGRMNVRLQGFGNVTKLLARQGEIKAIGVLLLLQGLGSPRLDEGNEMPVYEYEFDLPDDGLGTVNGISLGILREALE